MTAPKAFRQRARRAFLRGRLYEALRLTALAMLWVLAAVLLSGELVRPLRVAVVLLTLTSLFGFWGRDAGRVVTPALLLGSLPLGCALVARHVGHLCTGSSCVSWCVPLCTAGGIGAGVLLARYALASPHPWRSWWFGAAITASAGAMGCACVGLSGVAGMLGGLLVPQLFVQRRWL